MEFRLEILPRITPRRLRNLLRRPFGDQTAPAIAAFGAHVDQPVGTLEITSRLCSITRIVLPMSASRFSTVSRL